MKNFILILFLYLLKLVFSEYEKIELKYSSPYYYIPLNFPYKENKTYYIFSTKLPMSFYPSLNCTKCIENKLNNSKYENEQKNKSIPY